MSLECGLGTVRATPSFGSYMVECVSAGRPLYPRARLQLWALAVTACIWLLADRALRLVPWLLA